MHSNTGAALHPADFVRLLRTHIRWWAVPAVVFAVLAGGYSLVAPREWRATQALIVRPEAAGVSEERLGKFADLSEMKTLQETILELAKSQSVVRATLRDVGPPSNSSQTAQWPSELDVQNFRDEIDMRPPGGAEFGKTEVFYLSVRNSNRDRAGVLATALCKQLESRMQELREQRAQSMMAELQRTVAMADGDLASQIGRLSAFEANVGADLAELRSLNAETGGQGQVSQELQAIETERRANDAHVRENERLLKLLVAAKGDPQQLLATPNSLLVSQPAVSQLKNALVGAQIRTANLLGSREEAHPYVIAAREAESRVRQQLNNEVAVAIRGLQVEIELSADREKSLAAKYDAARERMSHLAEGRAQYSNLVASVQNHTRLVEAARKNLADARARQAGAHSASVISRIDGVEAGIWPS
ncbi:MAG TPA: Wzz/FepE/Etk N-terminal domain-containing protein, partial [Pirellulaceae bacterium]|nr:Wzz/FepE/Etk N-terminal domain-containing protein [Pirellulaceae bacterium]